MTTWNGLNICDACGWPMAGPYEEHRHRTNCEHVTKGEAANVLASELPGIPATKCGYGTDVITFELGEDANVRFRVYDDRTFALDELYILGGLETSQARTLVQALAGAMREIIGQQRIIDALRETGDK